MRCVKNGTITFASISDSIVLLMQSSNVEICVKMCTIVLIIIFIGIVYFIFIKVLFNLINFLSTLPIKATNNSLLLMAFND